MGIFDIFKSKKTKDSSSFDPKNRSTKETKVSRKEPTLEDLANTIHKKFHLTCDVLEKIKTKVSCVDLIKQLNLAGVSEDKYASNTFEVDLDTGNGNLFAKIQNADHSLSNFQRYSFSITGIQDYQGLYMSFSYEDKNRLIHMADNKMWGKMSNPQLQAQLESMNPTTGANDLYELLLAKGKFKK